MIILLWVTGAALLTGIISLFGGFGLLYYKRISASTIRLLVSFAAGSLLAAALVDLLPEALDISTADKVLPLTLVGIILFFITEKFLLWHHHAHGHVGGASKPIRTLIVVGDTVHNTLDGMVMAAAFSTSIPLGIVTTLAIILHEIPQEVGDFAVLLDSGMPRLQVLFYNLISSFGTLVGAWVAIIFTTTQNLLPVFLSLATGMFLYLGAADLIPEIHRETNTRRLWWQTGALILGAMSIWLLVQWLE